MLPRHACTSWTASTDPFGGWRVVGISTPGARSATGRDPHRNVARQPPLTARAHPSGTGRLVATPSRVVDRDRFDLQIATKSLCETSGQRNEATRPAPAASRAGPPGTNSGLSRSISPTVHPGPRAPWSPCRGRHRAEAAHADTRSRSSARGTRGIARSAQARPDAVLRGRCGRARSAASSPRRTSSIPTTTPPSRNPHGPRAQDHGATLHALRPLLPITLTCRLSYSRGRCHLEQPPRLQVTEQVNGTILSANLQPLFW